MLAVLLLLAIDPEISRIYDVAKFDARHAARLDGKRITFRVVLASDEDTEGDKKLFDVKTSDEPSVGPSGCRRTRTPRTWKRWSSKLHCG